MDKEMESVLEQKPVDVSGTQADGGIEGQVARAATPGGHSSRPPTHRMFGYVQCRDGFRYKVTEDGCCSHCGEKPVFSGDE